MEPTTVGWICIGALFILLALRVPIAIAMFVIGFLGYLAIAGKDPSFFALGSLTYRRVATFDFSVIPLFMIMGQFAYHAGFVSETFTALRKWLGWLPGGLVHATIGGAAAFGAACGSSLASCAILGKIAIPEMLHNGVDRKLAIGAVAASSTIAAMIPPSNLMIIYGFITEQSIAKLLIAGVIPGVVAATIYMIQVFIRVKINPSLAPPLREKITWKERLIATKGVWGIALVAATVIGGIYSGIFTPTEAGGIGAFFTFVIALAMRKLSWAQLRDVLRDTAKTSGMIFFIFAGSALFGYLLAITRLPYQVSEFLAGLQVNRYVILMGIVMMYIILGTLIDSISQLILTMPIIFPAISTLGFDPVWFGVLIVQLMEMALITPPFALNLFVLKGVVEDTNTKELIQAVVPYMVSDWITLSVYILFPQLALWLPSRMQ